MKILVVGGRGQGKSAHVRAHYDPEHVVDGESCPLEAAFSGDALDKLHILIRRLMEAGLEPMAFLSEELAKKRSWLLLCDEVGSGVIPLDPFEREWREQVGRICCELAQRAHVVERITCGLPQKLKGAP